MSLDRTQYRIDDEPTFEVTVENVGSVPERFAWRSDSACLERPCRNKKADANLAAKKLLQSQSEYLLILRKPRGPSKTAEKPEQETIVINKRETSGPRTWNPATELVLPVGHKFRDIERRMELLFPPQGG